MGVYHTLREANIVRQREWDTGGNIDLSYAGNELCGEAGELIEAVTDILDCDSTDFDNLHDELADVIICCDLIAMRLDLPLLTLFDANLPPPASPEAIKDMLLALFKEVGMVSNTIKKRERERFGMVGARGSIEDLGRNLQEVVLNTYRVGFMMQIDVSNCVAAKFNKTSIKNNLTTRLERPRG